LLAVALALATGVAYAGLGHHGYTSYDDPGYAADNIYVRSGLTLDGVRYAFTSFDCANWHPITWLSLMLDVELFGDGPGAHHWTSLALHVANALLLFAGLVALSGARLAFRSCGGALRAPSAPRGARGMDLSAQGPTQHLLWVALHWRLRTIRAPKAKRAAGRPLLCRMRRAAPTRIVVQADARHLAIRAAAHRRVAPARLSLAPRSARSELSPLIREKIPLLTLSLAASVLTAIAQQYGSALISLAQVTATARVANAALAYLGYLAKAIWPAGLAPLYPHPNEHVSMPAAAASFAVLASITVWVVSRTTAHRARTVGWLFYLGTLVPVIGLVQVGSQAMADRYSYVPLIGIFVAASWMLCDQVECAPHARVPVACACIASLAALAWLSQVQLRLWRSDVTLFRHTVDHTGPNPIAQIHLAAALQDAGRFEESIAHYREALSLDSADPYAWTGLGTALLRSGRPSEARTAFETAIANAPQFPDAWIGLGTYFMAQRDATAAFEAFSRAIALGSRAAEAYNNAGAALASGGEVEAALAYFEEAVRRRPGYVDAARNLSAARKRLAKNHNDG
jgi:Tfp pilus assembly protein PilF